MVNSTHCMKHTRIVYYIMYMYDHMMCIIILLGQSTCTCTLYMYMDLIRIKPVHIIPALKISLPSAAILLHMDVVIQQYRVVQGKWTITFVLPSKEGVSKVSHSVSVCRSPGLHLGGRLVQTKLIKGWQLNVSEVFKLL